MIMMVNHLIVVRLIVKHVLTVQPTGQILHIVTSVYLGFGEELFQKNYLYQSLTHFITLLGLIVRDVLLVQNVLTDQYILEPQIIHLKHVINVLQDIIWEMFIMTDIQKDQRVQENVRHLLVLITNRNILHVVILYIMIVEQTVMNVLMMKSKKFVRGVSVHTIKLVR